MPVNKRKSMPTPKKRRGASTSHSKTEVQMGVSLTPKGIQFLNTLAQKAGLSASDLFEHLATGKIAIYSDSAEIKFALKTSADEGAQADEEIHGVTAELQPNNQVAIREDQSVTPENNESLQQQAQEQTKLIADFQQQVAQLQEQLETRVAEQAAQQSSYETLQQQAQEQTKLITDFQQQVAQLQGQLQSRMTEQATQQSSYKSLQQQLQEQAHEVASLREQLAQLRPLATIGEAQLNKWRSRNFF
ncbi:MAG TPA: hypothetical protein V6C90_13560 [Coleofasciculaceae cyanobacterium]